VVQVTSLDDEAKGRIRNLQSIYVAEHQALVNWGLWSTDRSRIFPSLTGSSIWDQFKRDENDAYGDDPKERVTPEEPAKAEAAERPPHNERQAIDLDQRIHGAGGLSLHIREAIRAAYCNLSATEAQYPSFAGCPLDAFCERLEGALIFVRRWV
jgi:hypothetical protein